MNVGANGGRFDFDDGGTYCGGWNDGKAHGHGVCTGPKGQGEYSGAWQFGYEFSGIYLWPSGNSYEGQWMSGKRHGLGCEKKGRWIYKGEWTQGFKGRYGLRVSDISGARYEGTWANGLQDGYGVEIYADGGVYHGQIQQGLRHGFGIRRSVPYGLASRYRSKDVRDSLTSLRSEEDDERTQRERDKRMDENRGGFVLRSRSEPHDPSARSVSQGPRRVSLSNSADRRTSLRKTLLSKLRKQKSASDIEDISLTKKTSSFRSTASTISGDSKHSVKTSTLISSHPNTPNSMGTLDDGDHSFISQDDILDNNVVETYMGEWKADKRTGFGIAERSDGLKYEGEWFNNKKNGYGVTTYRDGSKEEGKYKNNLLTTERRKTSKLFLLRTSKFRDKIDAALNNAMKAATTAQQKAEIAMARANNARSKAHSAEIYAKQARHDSTDARSSAKLAAPDFRQPGEEKPQPFIPLDLDKQVDGKLVVGNHTSFSPPNGRLPMSSPPLSSHVPQSQSNLIGSPSIPLLDGGVYQGQPPAQQNIRNIGPASSAIPIPHQQQHQQQRPDYYRNVNPTHLQQMQKPTSQTLYNQVLDPRTGIPVSKQYNHLNQQLPGHISTPGSSSIDDDLTSLPNATAPQFVHSAVGLGQRSASKRGTFKRTNRIGSNEDLLHDPQSQDYNQPTSNTHISQYIRHSSEQQPNTSLSPTTNPQSHHHRHHHHHQTPMYDASTSYTSFGHDSGLSSGGTSYDPTHHPSMPMKSHTVEPYDVPQPIPIPRRKSLPSIVKVKPGDYKIDETARSNENLKEKETFIIENGIRKRVTEPAPAYTESGTQIPQATVMTSSTGSPILARRMIIESIPRIDAQTSSSSHTTSATTGGMKRGSMPTIDNVARQRHAAPSISREEATVLGSQRREELRRQRDLDSTTFGRLKNLLQSNTPATGTANTGNMHVFTQETSIQTDNRADGGIQNVIYRNRVFIAIFFLNLSLALWFIQLLR